ncbi:MAG: hypothetical protein ACK5GK_00400, partial [Akkermansiaceae bacterium]
PEIEFSSIGMSSGRNDSHQSKMSVTDPIAVFIKFAIFVTAGTKIANECRSIAPSLGIERMGWI